MREKHGEQKGRGTGQGRDKTRGKQAVFERQGQPIGRDGKKAAQLAKKACDLTQNKDPGCLDTYAAALAESGDFAEAVKTQSLVVADATLEPTHRAEAQARLDLYKSKKAYRQP